MRNATIRVIKSDFPPDMAPAFRFKKPHAVFGKRTGDVITTTLGGLAIVDTAENVPAVELKHLGTLCGEPATDWVPLSYLEPVNIAAGKLARDTREAFRQHKKRQRVKQDSQNVVNLHRELAETKHYVKDMRDSLDAIKAERDAADSALRKTQEAMAQMRTDWAGDRQFLIDEDVALHKELMLAENRANAAHRRAQRAEGAYTRLAKRYDKLASRVTAADMSPRATLESAVNLLDALANALGHPAGLGRGPVSGPAFDALRAALDESLGRWLSVAHFAQPLEPIDLGPKPRVDRPIPYKMTAKFDTETQKWNLKKTAEDGIMLLGDFIGSEPRTLKVDVAEMSKKLGELFGSLKKPTNAEST